jgi:hypothetical protein
MEVAEISLLDFFMFLSTFMLTVTLISLSPLLFTLFLSTPFYKIFRDNKKTEDLIYESVLFFAEQLGIENEPEIDLSLIFPATPVLTRGSMYKKRRDPEGYFIKVHMNAHIYSLIDTVAHEMIHVKQFNRGDLRVIGLRTLYQETDHTDTEYDEQPWEIEAFKESPKLSEKFLKHKNMKQPKILKMTNSLFGI